MDGLRLALIILGIVVVAVVYFWTARRRRIEREAGVFDRFDAWTDEGLDPLAPLPGDDRADSGGIADESPVSDADELTEPNPRTPAASYTAAAHTVPDQGVVEQRTHASAEDAESKTGTGVRGIAIDSARDDDAERSAQPVPVSRAGDAAPRSGEPSQIHSADAQPGQALSDRTPLQDNEVIEDLEAIVDSLDTRAEPHIGSLDDIDLHERLDDPAIRSSTMSAVSQADASRSAPQNAVGEPAGTNESDDGNQNAPRNDGDDRAVHESDTARDDAEMVVVLNVMARANQTFEGLSLKRALEGAGLKSGDMQLYHYRAETQPEDAPPIFSALNAVKPGTLDESEFEEMQTPGIALILRMPGLERPSESFELMLVAARRIAGELNGQVCDDSRSTLTGQALNHLRERIAAVAFRAQSGG